MLNGNRIFSDEKQDFEIKHENIVRNIASECMVLLKNNGTLPLNNVVDIALYGNGARQTQKGGTGSGDVNVRHYVTVEEGLEKAGFHITTKKWLSAYDEIRANIEREVRAGIHKQAEKLGIPEEYLLLGVAIPEAEYDISLDAKGDTAIYVLARVSGECRDRTNTKGDVLLTDTEVRDILALNKKYKNFILVLNVGGFIDLTPVEEVETILLLGQLGTATGDAFADVLMGKSYPSGKLAMTWSNLQNYPSTKNFGDNNNTNYEEGIYVGYRYFDSFEKDVSYPFGFGLGYTHFSVSTESVIVEKQNVELKIKVKNVGNFAGREVIQVYYSAPALELDKPYQELAVYGKTGELLPGQEEVLKLSYPVRQMASYSEKKASYLLEHGDYYIRVGTSSRNTDVVGIINLKEDITDRKVKNFGGKCGFVDTMHKSLLYEIPHTGSLKRISLSANEYKTVTYQYKEEPKQIKASETVSWDKVMNGNVSVDEFIGGLSKEQLVDLCIGNYKNADGSMEIIGNASTHVAGAAGETTGKLSELGIPQLIMADGPAGLRLSKVYTMVDDAAKSMEADFQTGDDGKQYYYQFCTAIPVGTALAQSFNDDIGRACGKLVGDEMERMGIDIWLAPALNIQRSPLCGRNFEYYSEDPLLSGRTAAAIVEGVQAYKGRAVTIKHFACNNQETNRFFSNSNVSERAMREIYLRGFEYCVKNSSPHFIMTSYNLINGEHACNRKDLLTDVLRSEWGFDGVVMTDWFVTGGMGASGEQWPCASAAGNVKAGNDITMPGVLSDRDDIYHALQDEEHPYAMTITEIQQAAKRVLNMLLKL